MNFTYGGFRYRTNRMNLLTEAKLVKRLIPIFTHIKVMSMAWNAATEAYVSGSEEDKEIIKKNIEASLEDKESIWNDFADALHELPDDDVTFIIGECMNVVERQDKEGDEGSWRRIWDNVSQRPNYADIKLPAMFAIVSAVLQAEFSDFFT